MLNDLTASIQAENVNASPSVPAGPFLPAMQDLQVSLRNYSDELNSLVWVFAGGDLKKVDESLLAIRYAGVVLDVISADVPFDCLAGPTLIEH
jgi:hypothetical protein